MKPDKAVLRKHKAKKPPKLFEANELRTLIDDKNVRGEGEDKPNMVKPDATLPRSDPAGHQRRIWPNGLLHTDAR